MSANATLDSIVISTGVLGESAVTASKLLADIARNAAFTDAEVGIAKRNAASTLEANEAEPHFLARRALYRALFGDHPYAAIAPTRQSLAQTTAADLKREYARRFRPDRALLVVVGNFDENQLSAAIHSGFDSWRASGEASVVDVGKPKGSITKAVIYVPRANSVQTALYLGIAGPSRSEPDYIPAQVANAIYGGMFGSRLINNIREDKGYTYSPFSSLSHYRESGVLVTQADVRNEVTGASFNEISYELNRMASTVPEEAELERAKRYLIGSLAIQLQSQTAVARSLAGIWTESLPPEELWRQSQRIEQVASKDVQSASRQYFPAWRMTVIAVGEEKVIKDELSPFGLEFQKAP